MTPSHTPQTPHTVYKIDRFKVPEAAIAAFTARLQQIQQALGTHSGCLQNWVLAGPSTDDGQRSVVTVVAWDSEAAFTAARSALQQRYLAEGFDPAAFMQAHGVSADMGVYRSLDARP